MFRRRTFSSVCAALALACTGCSVTIPVDATLGQPPLVERFPIVVGVRYADDLLTRKWLVQEQFRSDPKQYELQFQLGPATVALFDQVAGAMFEKVKQVEPSSSESLRDLGIDALLYIGIAHFGFTYPNEEELTGIVIREGTYVAEIAYELRFYVTRQEMIGKWHVNGNARKKGVSLHPWTEGTNGPRSISAKLAMQHAAARFMRDFYADKDIRKWLESRGLVSSESGKK